MKLIWPPGRPWTHRAATYFTAGTITLIQHTRLSAAVAGNLLIHLAVTFEGEMTNKSGRKTQHKSRFSKSNSTVVRVVNQYTT